MTCISAPYAAAGGPVRVYPAAAPTATGLVSAHGGAFASGDIEMPEFNWVARRLADAGIAVVAMDYRVAPTPSTLGGEGTKSERKRCPAASDDMLAAWNRTISNPYALGITRGSLAMGGACAGVTSRQAQYYVSGGPLNPRLWSYLPTQRWRCSRHQTGALRAALEASPETDEFGPEAVLGMYETHLGGSIEDVPPAAIRGLATPSELAEYPHRRR